MENYTEVEKPDKFLGKFIFTKRTITFGHKTLQLSNVSKIEVKSFRDTTKAVYKISDERLSWAWKVALVGVLLALWEPLRVVGVLFILVGAGIIWYYYDERNKKKDRVYNYYGLFFDCTSGKTEVLWSDHQDFVVQLFDRISNSMNYEQMSSFVANITDNSIQVIDSSNVMVQSKVDAGGNMQVGDNLV